MPVTQPMSRRLRLVGTALAAVVVLSYGWYLIDSTEPPRKGPTTESSPDGYFDGHADCADLATPPTDGGLAITSIEGASSGSVVSYEIELTNTSDLNAHGIHLAIGIELYDEDVTGIFDPAPDESEPAAALVRAGSSVMVTGTLTQPGDWPDEDLDSPDLTVTAMVAEIGHWCEPLAR